MHPPIKYPLTSNNYFLPYLMSNLLEYMVENIFTSPIIAVPTLLSTPVFVKMVDEYRKIALIPVNY